MLDIVKVEENEDLTIMDSIAPKAGNVLSVQLDSLEYAQGMGVDLAYFFESDFQFQSESFKAYLIQRLIEQQVNVFQVLDLVNTLYRRLVWFVGQSQSGINPLSFVDTDLLGWMAFLDFDGKAFLTQANEELFIK
jgi:hypothetical protein